MARTPLTGEQMRRVVRVDGSVVRAMPSEQEMHERRLFVRQLHAAGILTADIVAHAIEPSRDRDGNVVPARFDCSAESIRHLIAEIREELRRELEMFAPTDRAAALNRLYGDVARLRGEVGVMRNLTVKDWAAIRSHSAEVRHHEKLIAEMEGTLKPLKVEHTSGMSDELVRALAGMTREQTEQAIREEQQRARDAGSITTSAEPQDHATQTPALTSPGPRRPVPPARPSDRVGGAAADRLPAAQPAAHTRERSSDAAARRDAGAGTDADVDGRARPGVGGARVVG